MQQSTTQPNPPLPNDMALILFTKFIRKLCGAISTQSKDVPVADVEEKLKHLKKMFEKNIITEKQYSITVDKLLAEYIKSHPRKNEKNAFNELEKYIA